MGFCIQHSNSAAWPPVLCDSWARLYWQPGSGLLLAKRVINHESGPAPCPRRGIGKASEAVRAVLSKLCHVVLEGDVLIGSHERS